MLLHSPAELRSKTEICRLRVTVSGIRAGAIQDSALLQTTDLVQNDMEKILNRFDKFILKAPYLASASKFKVAIRTMFNFGKTTPTELEAEKLEAHRFYLTGLERLCDELSYEYPKFSFDLHQDEDPRVYSVAICMLDYESVTIERALLQQLRSPGVTTTKPPRRFSSANQILNQQPPRRSSMMSMGYAPRRISALTSQTSKSPKRISVMSSQSSSAYSQIYTVDEDLSKEKNKFTFDRVPLAMQIPQADLPKTYQPQVLEPGEGAIDNQAASEQVTFDRIPLVMQIPPIEIHQIKESSGYQTPEPESDSQNSRDHEDTEDEGVSERHIKILQKMGLEREKAIKILNVSKQDLEIACGFALMAV